jgi:hypothetical protein
MRYRIVKLMIAIVGIALGGVLMAATSNAATVHATPATPHLRFSAASASPVAATHTVTTTVTLNPDSGDAGNTWANDDFTQIMTVHRVKAVPVKNCAAGSKRCFYYTFTLSDKGTATTIAGQVSPGNPAFTGSRILDVTEHVQMTGGTSDGSFYSSYKRYYDADVPTVMNENGIPAAYPYDVSNFVQVGQPGARFASVSLGADIGWTYVAPEGVDGQCPRYSGEWVDSQANGWGQEDHGNILAPDAADCSTSLG